MTYINTPLLVDELVNLQHEESGGRVRVYERSGMRKDRYSSLSYNYYVATQLESRMIRSHITSQGEGNMFLYRPPSIKRR